jgi:hypothetical protein
MKHPFWPEDFSLEDTTPYMPVDFDDRDRELGRLLDERQARRQWRLGSLIGLLLGLAILAALAAVALSGYFVMP